MTERWLVHDSGVVIAAEEITDPIQETTISGISEVSANYTLVDITSLSSSADVVVSPEKYLYNSGLYLKPLVNYSITSPTVISPTATQGFNWTVTGTLPAPFTQPTTSTLVIGRVLEDPTEEMVVSPFPNGASTFSGTLASGINVTFNPNSVPGHYQFAIGGHRGLWRDPGLRITASGANAKPTTSGAISAWTVQTGSTWTADYSTSVTTTSNNSLLGLNLETGQIVMYPGASISLLSADGITTEVDLIGQDGSLDIAATGTGAQINLRAVGEDSNIQIRTIGFNSQIELQAVQDQTDILINAAGVESSVQIGAAGVDSRVDILANDSGATINIDSSGGEYTRFLGSRVNFLVDKINFTGDTGDTIDFGHSGGGTATVITFSGTLAPVVFEAIVNAQNSIGSLRLPQRTSAELATENPGVTNGGRIAFDTTQSRLEYWDGGSWQPVSTGTGGGVTDHGDLTGLTDDDHTQYSLVAGTRAFTGTVAGITPTTAAHLSTKGYVDASHKAIVGNDFINVISGANTLQITADAIVSSSANLVVTTGTAVVTLAPSATPIYTTVTATTITGTSVQVGGTVSAQRGEFSSGLTVSGIPVPLTIGGAIDHGTLTGLTDDDHTQYLLASQATNRTTFTNNWTDLTDAGATTLHKHDHGGMDGLADDDHTQYIRVDGTRPFTGDQDLGNNDITSVGTLTGQIVQLTTELRVPLSPGDGATNPTVTITTDQNTGMFSNSADTLGFTAGGTQVLAVTNPRVSVVGAALLGLPAFSQAGQDAIGSPVQADTLYNTSSGTVNYYDGSAWRKLSYDHGVLSGREDDDHPQYVLANGNRAFSGNISHGGNNITNVGTITATTVTATTVTGTSVQVGGTVSAQRGEFSTGLTVSGLPVSLGAGSGGVSQITASGTSYTGNVTLIALDGVYLRNSGSNLVVSGTRSNRVFASKTSDQSTVGATDTNITQLTGITIPGANGSRSYLVNGELNVSDNDAGGARLGLMKLWVGANGTTADTTPNLVVRETITNTTGFGTHLVIAGWPITPAAGAKIGLSLELPSGAAVDTVYGSPTTNGGSWLSVVEII